MSLPHTQKPWLDPYGKKLYRKAFIICILLMVNPDCFLTREQSKPTSIRVTFQVVFGNGKRCILHKYLYFITHCSNCIHNHGTIWGDSPCAIFSAAVGATGHYPSLASINCLLNNFYSAPTPTAEVKSFQERPWQSHQWNCLSSM